MNLPHHCWPTPFFEGRIVLRWITAYLSPLVVSLTPVKGNSFFCCHLNVVKALMCQVHSLIWNAALTLLS